MDGETAFTSRNGVTTVVSQSITAHRSPGGEWGVLSSIARDITESKNAQEALRRSE